MTMIIVIVILIIHLSYYLFLFSRLISHKDNNNPNKEKKILSLVVCFKNEEDQVDKLLPLLIDQEISDIVLVDDFSSDDTFARLQKYASNSVKIIKPSIDRPGKKQAIHDGITSTKQDRILVTDADCSPINSAWASTMNLKNKPIVLGYSPMYKRTGLVNLFSRYETYMTGVQYLSYAISGIPYMGVGRNMIIDRSLRTERYSEIKGKDLPGGDDDLTINAIADSHNTAICIAPSTFVYTDSADNWSAFIKQKTRHISTSVHYGFKHQLLLGLFSGSQILFYILLIGGVFSGTISPSNGLLILAAKQIAQLIIHLPLTKKLKAEISIPQLLLLDLLLFLYYLVMPVLLLIRKKDNRWN